MKTVVISGYYGFENLGDEALLASMITALKSEIPQLRLIVLSAKPEKTSALYGVEAVHRWNPLSVITALSCCDLLISGGGSLLQDVTGKLTIPYYLSIVWLAKILGKRVIFYGQGIGPINGKFGRALTRWIANKVDFITLRDSASARLLREIGATVPPVEVTADPVFGINNSEELSFGEPFLTLDFPTGDKPGVGIFVREWKGIPGYKKAVAGLADYFYSKNRQVIFIPMQYPADIAPIREIEGMMKHKPVILDRELSFRQLMDIVASMDLVIGMRLHALIIATLCAVPMIGLSYDPKVSEFLESVKQPVFNNLEDITSVELIQQVDEVDSNAEVIRTKLNELRTDLRAKALRNSEIALQLLRIKG